MRRSDRLCHSDSRRLESINEVKRLFITGTDTEVGKTWVACRIIRRLCRDGHSVGAWKPVCSGAIIEGPRKRWEDVDALLDAIAVDDPRDPIWINRICPQRFDAPLAPNIAARLEQRTVCDKTLREGHHVWDDLVDLLLIEGAGGLLSPASDRLLVADLALHLNAPLVIVAANRLGCIHQTLATVEAAASRGLTTAAVILNQVTPPSGSPLDSTNEQELRRLLPHLRLVVNPHNGDAFADSDESVNPEGWFA